MRLLLDTNVFLELLLAQEKAGEVRTLLQKTEAHDLFISDFALHSIGLLLFRHGQPETFRQFLSDLVLNAGLRMLWLLPGEMGPVIESAKRFRLDFDDAYQYAVAEKYELTIVSYDSDFDRTTQGRMVPAQIE